MCDWWTRVCIYVLCDLCPLFTNFLAGIYRASELCEYEKIPKALRKIEMNNKKTHNDWWYRVIECVSPIVLRTQDDAMSLYRYWWEETSRDISINIFITKQAIFYKKKSVERALYIVLSRESNLYSY